MFAARSDVLDRSIELDGASYSIVGVMPPNFEYPFKRDLPYGDSHIESTQIWVRLALDAEARSSRALGNNVLLARVRPGVSIHQAQMFGIHPPPKPHKRLNHQTAPTKIQRLIQTPGQQMPRCQWQTAARCESEGQSGDSSEHAKEVRLRSDL